MRPGEWDDEEVFSSLSKFPNLVSLDSTPWAIDEKRAASLIPGVLNVYEFDSLDPVRPVYYNIQTMPDRNSSEKKFAVVIASGDEFTYHILHGLLQRGYFIIFIHPDQPEWTGYGWEATLKLKDSASVAFIALRACEEKSLLEMKKKVAGLTKTIEVAVLAWPLFTTSKVNKKKKRKKNPDFP